MNMTSGCPRVPEGTTLIIRPEKEEDLIIPAALLACGELVAFPTETVYGLGADATNPSAVANIFKAKGRPSDNPLIVHVARKTDIPELVREVTPLAKCLMDAFMPGPITLVMKKSSLIPDLVSAGLDTVGIRMPSHPVAQKLILLSGVPVAAPSANISGSPSPTRARHVEKDLKGKIPCIVDGGSCKVGLESSVVDVTGAWPVILRPGAVTMEMIADACGKAGITAPEGAVMTHDHADEGEAPRAPGMKYRHYAPRATVSIIMPGINGRADEFLLRAGQILTDENGKLGIFCGRQEHELLEARLSADRLSRVSFYVFGENDDINGAARGLFDGVRSLDNDGAERILAAGFTGEGLEKAYMNRLEKAAGEKKELDPLNAALALEHRKILFVCTGNTCRSPMAEAIFNLLASRRGPFSTDVNDGGKPLISSSSAGIYADNGSPASAYAVEAVNRLYGADLSRHKSRTVTAEILKESDMVFAVTREHAAKLRFLFPSYSGKIYSFSEYCAKKSIFVPQGSSSVHMPDIPDPFGQNSAVYYRTAQSLYELIDAVWPSVIADMEIG